jgi:hypothetical protein
MKKNIHCFPHSSFFPFFPPAMTDNSDSGEDLSSVMGICDHEKGLLTKEPFDDINTLDSPPFRGRIAFIAFIIALLLLSAFNCITWGLSVAESAKIQFPWALLAPTLVTSDPSSKDGSTRVTIHTNLTFYGYVLAPPNPSELVDSCNIFTDSWCFYEAMVGRVFDPCGGADAPYFTLHSVTYDCEILRNLWTVPKWLRITLLSLSAACCTIVLISSEIVMIVDSEIRRKRTRRRVITFLVFIVAAAGVSFGILMFYLWSAMFSGNIREAVVVAPGGGVST